MRVFIISHMYPTVVSPLSGIFVQKQAEALQRAGLDLTLLHPTPWVPPLLARHEKWGAYRHIPEKEEHRGIPVYHPRMIELPKGMLFSRYPWGYRQGMKNLMARLIKEKPPDVIHAHVAHPDGAAAVYFGKTYGIPVVVTIHGQDFAHTLQRDPRSARSVRETLAAAAAVILVSDKLRNNYQLEQWADDLSKYRVIYNGVHWEEVFHEELCRQAVDKGPILYSLAFLREPKGHRYVLEALPVLRQKYPGLSYRIAGDGEERNRLEALVRELNLSDCVDFLGFLPNEEAMKEMSRSDIFLMPSWNEAFGISYVEAMAHGKPVIATKGEGIGGMIERERTGLLVSPRDAHAIAAAVDRLLQDPEESRLMGQRGRALVEKTFTWERNAALTLAVYEEAQKQCIGKERYSAWM